MTWLSSMSGESDNALIPLNGKKTQLDADDLTDLGTRQLTFCDAEGGGYRTIRLRDLTSVSAKQEDDGHTLQLILSKAMQESKKEPKK